MEKRELAEDATPEDHEPTEDTTPEDHEPTEDTTPEDHEPTEDTTPEDHEPTEDTTPEDHEPTEDTTPEEAKYKLFGLFPLKIAVPVIVVLPIAGFLAGMIGAGADEATVPVDFVISPQRASSELQPGATSQFTVLIDNPTESGVRVSSIGAGASEATAGCPAGAVTSKAVDDPPGYIRPNGVRAYRVTATMAPTAGDSCAGQAFTLPLTAELVSAG